MKRRTFLKGLGIGAVGVALGTYDYSRLLTKENQANPASEMPQATAAEMIYREIPHTGQKVSVISLGIGSLHEASEREITQIVDYALGAGHQSHGYDHAHQCARRIGIFPRRIR